MNVALRTTIKEKISHFVFQSGNNLGTFEETERQDLQKLGKLLTFKKRENLYREGDLPKGVFVLTKGKVKIWQLNSDGAVQIIFIYSVGEIFGHRPILGNMKQPVSATCLEDCELLFIEKEEFLSFVKDSERLRTTLVQSIGIEYSVMVNRISVFAQRGIKERLALFLLVLNETYKRPEQIIDEAEISLNRTDLANYVGTSIENLVRTIKSFRESGYINTNGKCIYIKDFEGLYTLSRV